MALGWSLFFCWLRVDRLIAHGRVHLRKQTTTVEDEKQIYE